MPWAKFDDRYPWHRKVRPLSDAAFRLDVSSVCWCSENLTDGLIEPGHLGLLSDVKRPAKAAQELVKFGRWHGHGHDCEVCSDPVPNGYVIHDFLEYNPTRAKVEAERELRRSAGRMGGKASGAARANAKQGASDVLKQTASKTEAQGVRHVGTPVPVPEPLLPMETSVGGVTSVDARAKSAPPPIPRRCVDHQYDVSPPKCGACADARIYAGLADTEAETLPDYRLRVVVPLCGECDDRWIDTPRGAVHCPNCHPAEQKAAS